MSHEIAYRGFRIWDAQVGVVSNYRAIVDDREYFFGEGQQLHSLLSNFCRIDPIPFSDAHHLYLHIFDNALSSVQACVDGNGVYVSGNIAELESSSTDKRQTIFGNMGLFTKLCVKALEMTGLYTFHSTSMYCPADDTLYMILGGSGSGKSTVLLAGLEKGFQLFGSELTHFSYNEGRLKFFKGSVYQNCRVGNLVSDFPGLIERFKIPDLPSDDIWHSYRSVNMRDAQTALDVLDNPNVVSIFPRIEARVDSPEVSSVNPGSIVSDVFTSLCDKVSPPSWLYNSVLVPSIDDRQSQRQRLEAARAFCSEAKNLECWRVMASPHNCLDGVTRDCGFQR